MCQNVFTMNNPGTAGLSPIVLLCEVSFVSNSSLVKFSEEEILPK